jgi:DnaJ-class molecular chaperone
VDRVLHSSGCHYALLGVARTVLAADLKKHYHKLCLRLHPDKATHPQATQAFQLVQALTPTQPPP